MESLSLGSLVFVECVLCKGLLPTSNDDQNLLLSHMKEHHRALVNIPFIISACFLDQEGIEATMAFITSRTNSVKSMDDPLSVAEDVLVKEEKRAEISPDEDSEGSDDDDQKSFNEDTSYQDNLAALNDVKTEKKEDAGTDQRDEESFLSRKEIRRQRLLALCLEECGEKKARTANDEHLKRYHAGERLFQCADCPKKFKKSHKLETHRRLKHTAKSKISVCDICGKNFHTFGAVVKHKKNIHLLNQGDISSKCLF